ncbi:pimeloyl-ACP methyl ester carboxylesterase [Streptomyces sp. Amel2xB2]|uniref:alpha/beta fold hydrolase n=1 Tax=Streptomyces sp. Amel2xB2 TaxID=1305829 RepID=UPI000DBA3B5B|nr:alpha/beta hydrolase [Streptomyces sp. Amel2xB2]RAJ62438.1 pimeloyl-ACP methyl ester carboxylesterase [Streptomyces sp. Amel2xB2]
MARLTASLGGTPGPYDPPPAARELSATSADGARLHVEVHGRDGDPAVVLIHGWTCSTAFWAPVIRELTASGHRVVAYDQRGHGRTPATDGRGYGPSSLADDLCAVLEAALQPGERAVLCGHSMGAMTLVAAAGRPELERRAAALLLCNTGTHRLASEARVLPFRSERGRERAHRQLLLARLPLGPVTPVTRKVLKYATMGPDSSPEQTAAVARVVHACRPRERAAWGAVLAKLDIAANVGALTPPTAVVTGTADRLTPPALARELAAELPYCVGLYELPRRGHMAPVETSGEVSGLLRDLVRVHLTGGEGQSGAAHAGEGEARKPGAGKPEGVESGLPVPEPRKPESRVPGDRRTTKEETP